MPGAESLQLFRELSRDKDSSVVYVFGHAPQLDDLLATSVNSKHHITAMKKAGVALVEMKRVPPPAGEIVWLSTPKILRKVGSAKVNVRQGPVVPKLNPMPLRMQVSRGSSAIPQRYSSPEQTSAIAGTQYKFPVNVLPPRSPLPFLQYQSIPARER